MNALDEERRKFDDGERCEDPYSDVPEEVRHAVAVALLACREASHKGFLAAAVTYLDKVPAVARRYGEAEVRTQLLYALHNMRAWKGPSAQEVKLVLKRYATLQEKIR